MRIIDIDGIAYIPLKNTYIISLIIEEWIDIKIQLYKEPQRRGVKKGNLIGLSKIKYKASLLLAFKQNLKDIAKELGVSYGLLRKWGTEEEFNTKKAEHYRELKRLLTEYK